MTNLQKIDKQTQLTLVRKTLACSDEVPNDEIEIAIAWCKAKGLDPLKKPVAIVPYTNKKTNETTYQVFITAEAVKTIAKRGGWIGNDDYVYGPEKKYQWTSYNRAAEVIAPEWGQVTVYARVDGEKCAFTGPRVYFSERNQKNSNWEKQPIAMLNKCVLIAALRNAFPEELGGEFIQEEGKEIFNYEEPKETKPEPPTLKTPKKKFFKEQTIIEAVVEPIPKKDSDKIADIIKEIDGFASLEANETNREIIINFIESIKQDWEKIKVCDPKDISKLNEKVKALQFDWEIEAKK